MKFIEMFYFNSFAIIITILLFAILPLLYLTAIISAMILVLVNRKYTKKPMATLLKDIEWEIIFFFISLYVVVYCLEVAGFEDLFKGIPFFGFILGIRDQPNRRFSKANTGYRPPRNLHS